jgi:hypothetical protein
MITTIQNKTKHEINGISPAKSTSTQQEREIPGSY